MCEEIFCGEKKTTRGLPCSRFGNMHYAGTSKMKVSKNDLHAAT